MAAWLRHRGCTDMLAGLSTAFVSFAKSWLSQRDIARQKSAPQRTRQRRQRLAASNWPPQRDFSNLFRGSSDRDDRPGFCRKGLSRPILPRRPLVFERLDRMMATKRSLEPSAANAAQFGSARSPLKVRPTTTPIAPKYGGRNGGRAGQKLNNLIVFSVLITGSGCPAGIIIFGMLLDQ